MARVALTDDTGALYGAPANWLNGKQKRWAPVSSVIPDPARAFPPIAAVFPTFGSSNTTTVSSPVEHAATVDNTGPLRWYGAAHMSDSSGLIGASVTTYSVSGNAPYWEFVTDAPRLNIRGQFHSASPYTLTVDGETVTPTPQAAPGNPYLTLDWVGARKIRHYRFHANDGFKVAALVVSATDSVLPAPVEASPLVAWFGDSYSGGAPQIGQSYTAAIPHLTAGLLGWKLRRSADGGSGYQQYTPNQTKENSFYNRVGELSAVKFSAAVFAGGINDPLSGLEAAATDTLQRFAAEHPGVPMYVLGPWSPSTTYQTDNAAKWDAIAAAVAATPGAHFIDTRGWVTGTGKEGATTGDGNADLVILSDGTHPTPGVGVPYLATRTANSIATVMAENMGA